MGAKVIGFVGLNSYDIILYLAKVIKQLGGNTLMIDNSKDKALSEAIPDGMGKKRVIDYGGVDFIREFGKDPTKFKTLIQPYTFVLVDFGSNVEHPLIQRCDEIFLITDFQKHNIRKISEVKLPIGVYHALLLRYDISSKLTEDFVLSRLTAFKALKDNCNVFRVRYSAEDLESAMHAQYDTVFKFNKISKDLFDFLVKVLSVDYSERRILAALKNASRAK